MNKFSTIKPNRIRAIRAVKDPSLRQKDLARLVGCSQSDIGKYERGERIPSLPMAIRIATALGHRVEHVFWTLCEDGLLFVHRQVCGRLQGTITDQDGHTS